MRTSLGLALIAALVALAVALGILGHSVLTGVLLFAGFLLVWIGCSAASAQSFGFAWLAISAGVALTAFAMWHGAMGGRWLWLVPWMLEGGVVTVVGADARPGSRRNGDSMIAFGLLLMLFAVLASLFL